MRTLSIDIETFSSVSLADCGVYRYSESPDFEILLLGYAYDDEPVTVIDLTREEIPASLRQDIIDNPDVVKSAWNANFEITCLSRWLGVRLDPAEWTDTMILAAELGLPRSLKDVGLALGLGHDEVKDRRGKALIRYFSVPCGATKANGGRTRNRPQDDLAKWAEYVEYNRQDVVSERAIRKRLSGYPLTEAEQAAWVFDQKINARGVRCDRRLAENAVRIANEHTALLMAELREITGLENPNSLTQLKGWFGTDAPLDKAAVEERLKTERDPARRRALEIRREIGKSSVKKYEAMLNYMCADDRCRGLFQFYGANRTGRWCLTGDHEVLTPDGWVRLDEWTGGRIACWTPGGEVISFQKAEALRFSYEGQLYHYNDGRIDQISTPDHRMYVKKRYDKPWEIDTVENMARYRPSIPFTGRAARSFSMDSIPLRILVMTQADGHFTSDGDLRFAFIKTRKVERCKHLLRQAEIPFTTYVTKQYGKDRFAITIPRRSLPLYLRMFGVKKTFGWWTIQEDPDVFFDELVHWDGYHAGPNSIQYVTVNKQNADVVQALAHISGRSAVIKLKHEETENWSTAYCVDIWNSPGNCHEIRKKPEVFDFSGTVYCASTKTGFFLVRRNGRCWVTGNSGRGVQLQNLYRNELPDLEIARDMVKAGDREGIEMLFGNVPETLSQLIRTAFVPKDGCVFAVADFSAIEARVIAWLAGEEWRMRTFREGGDIYCASASAMFHVPVVKHGINGHLRQKGKIAELALGYGGNINAMTAMGALKMGLTEEELPEIVSKWREASPKICGLWTEIGNAAMNAVKYRERIRLRHGVELWRTGKLLHMKLPSGRCIRYFGPHVTQNRYGGDSIGYQAYDAGKWGEAETWGGKLVENLVQATARDCLLEAMTRVAKRCPDIVMHVHDEMIVEVPEDEAEEALAFICNEMGREISWAPGLLLRGDGYLCEYYRKD